MAALCVQTVRLLTTQQSNAILNLPFFPVVFELFHRPRCAPHPREQYIDAAIAESPKSIAEV
jgi:hypothetical protein